jgi:hypothetical protein
MAPISGVYLVVHDLHRGSHEALIVRGEVLPACRVCRLDVRFRVVEAVSHLTHDWDFAGPASVPAPPPSPPPPKRHKAAGKTR